MFFRAYNLKKILSASMAFVMLIMLMPLSLLPGMMADALVTETPMVVVTGKSVVGNNGVYTADNVGNERAYTLEEIKAMGAVTLSYTAINTFPTKNFYKATGVPIDALLKGTAFDASKDKLSIIASDGYTISFAPGAAYARGAVNTTGFGVPRYFYPGVMTDSAAGAVVVPTILSWANARNTAAVPDKLDEFDSLSVVAGQLDIEDQNNPLFNKNVNTIRGGDAITEAALTVNGKAYTRAEILMMPRSERSYTYQGRGEVVTVEARGVPIKTLLEGVNRSNVVTFATADNFSVQENGMTVGELIDKNYILAYETLDNGEWKGLYRDVEADKSKNGVFTLYGDGERPSAMIASITTASKNASFKHIENSAPYNIDALTGATLTVEGPGVAATTPIAIRELEAAVPVIAYAEYANGGGKKFTYEGTSVLSIIDGVVNTSVVKADEQVAVVFKNRWRQDIATIAYSDLKAAEAAGKPVLLAHGVSDGSTTAPFVYDGATGFVSALDNADGPIRLVYDPSVFTSAGTKAPLGTGAFLSCAYLYVQMGAGEPGFKHSTASDKLYDNPANTEYLITLTGSVLGREVNYTVEELEAMVEYDSSGKPKAGGLGWRDLYGLSNTTYWYVNQYEGIQLWQLLTQKLGVSASKYSEDKNTLVSFSAWDNYRTTAQFSMYQLAHPELFYYYEKSPLDIGTSRPTKQQLATAEYQPTYTEAEAAKRTKDSNGYPVMRGYPVLLAYGVNGYPYVRDSNTPGFYGGLGNDGGPLKVIFGKTDGMNRANASALENYAYFFNNGSTQLQRAQEIYVGDEARYSTHSQNPGYKSMAAAADALTVEIISTSGVKTTKTYTLAELENVLYGASKRDMDTQGRQEKAYYPYGVSGGKPVEDLFEGVNLWYLLSEDIGMAGYLGTVNLYAEGAATPAATFTLDSIRQPGYNTLRSTSGLGAMVAFAKNGYPLVKSAASPGYVATDTVTGKQILNSGGPLMFVRAQTVDEVASGSVAAGGDNAAAVLNLNKIVVNLEADPYSHNEEDGKQLVEFSGAVTNPNGLKLSVSALETKQKYMVTGTYIVGGKSDEYRGLDLFRLLYDASIGASARMASVIVSNEAGQETVLTADDLQDAAKGVILAYGMTVGGKGAPLATANGGLMRLVINGASASECITNVTKIEVVAAEASGWTHSYGNFLQYAGYEIEISGSNLAKRAVYSVADIEAMENIMVNDVYQMGGTIFIEGIDLYKLLQTIGFAGDLTTSEITVYASDGYAVSLTGTDLEKGVNGKPLLVAYAVGTTADNGLPLVPNDTDAGFDPNVGNAYGPLRLVVNDNTGWCNKWINRIVVGAEVEETAEQSGFVVYHAGEELPFAGTRGIVADDAGGFWVGTYGGGLAYVNNSGGVTVYDEQSADAILTGIVSAVALDKSRGVWFTQNASYMDPTAHKGVGYLKDGEFTWYEQGDELPSDYIQAIEIEADGTIWFGSGVGITRYDGEKWETWTREHGFPANSVSAIKSDGRGGVWIGFYPDGEGTPDDLFTGGYVHMDKDANIDFAQEYVGEYSEIASSSLLADVWVRCFAIDSNGGIWAVRSGSYANMPTSVGGRIDYIVNTDDGYVLEKSYTGEELLGSLLKNKGEIRAVAADPIEGVWFGTTTSGVVYKLDAADEGVQYSSETSAWEDDPTLDNVYYLCFGNGALYVGSAGGVAVDKDLGVFTDVVNHWARADITKALELGIVNGVGNRKFAPGGSLTRAQFVTMLYRVYGGAGAGGGGGAGTSAGGAGGGSGASGGGAGGSGAAGALPFSDVIADAWYADAVAWASQNGIVGGYGDGRFGPGDSISRQQMVTILYRYCVAYGIDVSVGLDTNILSYEDAFIISEGAYEAFQWACGAGVIGGKPGGYLDPHGGATRAEVATVIMRFLGVIK
ncbi:MAG: S-layer homology domain-containing protein [Oscillospiraceae bacterium]|nr:S-layer homology domain-containing protein [Oscillospiraceae bacterium]